MALGSRDYGDIQDVLLEQKTRVCIWEWLAELEDVALAGWQSPATVGTVPGWVPRGPELQLPGTGRVNSPRSITALNPSPWQIKPIRGTSNPQSPALFKSAQQMWLGSLGQGTARALEAMPGSLGQIPKVLVLVLQAVSLGEHDP